MIEPILGDRAQAVVDWTWQYRRRLAFGAILALQLLTLWVSWLALERADSAAVWASDAYSAAHNASQWAEQASNAADDVFDEVRAIRDGR